MFPINNFHPNERKDFTVGESAQLTRRFTQEDVDAYAQISGDRNPVHINAAYAAGTWFERPIVHGMLVAGMISSVLGNQLPGPGSIYLSQELRFKAPVHPGDEVTARVEVLEWDAFKGRVRLLTEVTNQSGATVVVGEARLVMSSFLGNR